MFLINSSTDKKQKNMKIKIIILWALLLVPIALCAQITIGMSEKNERAAILDLKTHKVTNPEALGASNVTTDKGGLNLPRVMLTTLATLEPFINVTDTEWLNPLSKIKEKHTGLVVYNLTANSELQPGAYIWNGNTWAQLFQEPELIEPNRIIFPLPAFSLPLVSQQGVNTLTFNLYEVYANSKTLAYSKTNMSTANYAAFSADTQYKTNELDYIITHYDTDVLSNISINDQGIMSYTVLNINPPRTSFINIYLMVKKGKEHK